MNSQIETPYISYPTSSGHEKMYLRFITIRKMKFVVTLFHGVKVELNYNGVKY